MRMASQWFLLSAFVIAMGAGMASDHPFADLDEGDAVVYQGVGSAETDAGAQEFDFQLQVQVVDVSEDAVVFAVVLGAREPGDEDADYETIESEAITINTEDVDTFMIDLVRVLTGKTADEELIDILNAEFDEVEIDLSGLDLGEYNDAEMGLYTQVAAWLIDGEEVVETTELLVVEGAGMLNVALMTTEATIGGVETKIELKLVE